MQKTAKKTPPVSVNATAYVANAVNPLRQIGSGQLAYGATGQAYQPTITWQDTTSNATYSSASSVLDLTVK